ncbi:hypothetical protein AB8A05_29660 [Tardiphaga sp. 538_B7_N1_4]|uniref:hypothetical protein n=1 Tax=Tardiphaga sp. 538_B7_N1_4 TaxID=3240778 RepID=UPI003F295ED4
MADKKLCFVIGPIGAHKSEIRADADKLLKFIVKPTFSTNFKDYKVVRADEISQPGMVDSQVISSVIEADLVIADLSTKNANAFYELGIRHLLQKPVIHMFRRNELPPADIAAYRGIEFDLHEKTDITAAKSALRKAVSETMTDEFQIENPVTRSRAMIRLKEQEKLKREELLGIANSTQMPIAHLDGMISHLASSKANYVVGPETLSSYLDQIKRSRDAAKKLFSLIEQLFR